MKSPSCDKPSMKRGLWSEEEDAKIVDYVSKHGIGKWTSVPKKAGLRRCGKSCRLRWNNYLRPDLKHENFTPKEEELIIKLHAAIGSRWSMIAQQLPGRTDNDVKNYWNTKIKKRLADMGIDPVTHKPFSQIFADYGNIGVVSKPGMRVLSFNKDLKSVMVINKIDTSPISPFSIPTSMSMSVPVLVPGHTIVSPKSESILQNFANHNKYMSNNNNSLDLLAELQAINLVKVNHESSSSSLPNFCIVDQGMGYSSSHSSSSSSSSTCSSAAKDLLPIGFNWNEFLIEDELLPSEAQECLGKEIIQVDNEDTLKKVEGLNSEDVEDHTISSKELNEKTSCESSFVEALLAKESEMLMEFPDLMGQEFY